MEALEDPSSDLTYCALTGARKQSIEDVERLFRPGIINFMRKHNYKSESKYVAVVRNWRRAIDERGSSEIQRQCFLNDFLDYNLDDWMAWHKECRDFSLLEVNR